MREPQISNGGGVMREPYLFSKATGLDSIHLQASALSAGEMSRVPFTGLDSIHLLGTQQSCSTSKSAIGKVVGAGKYHYPHG